ncbi:MAG TPA: hypothetical protein VEF72_15090 [Mycobacterium sp.]|nr:hypothetical protein [Mycobacterium sp.]
MSFDVFVQGFQNGDWAEGDGVAVRAVLAPHLVGRQALVFSDGSAEFYARKDQETGDIDFGAGFMVTNVGGRVAWDVIVAAARAGRFAIMPVGCPVAITDAAMADDLPPDLVADVGMVVVSSGAELLQAITTS